MVKFITVTPNAETIMGHVARVSNPSNQNNPDVSKLLDYCIKHKHWSVFETASMTLEVTTSRAIAAQILRHRSMNFQEFSQRYAKVNRFVDIEARRQDNKNRQNSIDDLSEETKQWFKSAHEEIQSLAKENYNKAIDLGIAKECARFLLPLSTETTIYITANVRSWIHYIDLRSGVETQKEHRDVALACKEIFKDKFPILSYSLNW